MELSTSVVIIAPHHVQEVAVPMMRQYAPNDLMRIPAHITLLFPFVPYAELDAACTQLREVCAGVPPFEVKLRGFGYFPKVAYMKPVDPAPIKGLFQQISKAFPQHLPYNGRFGNDLTPHMTIADFTHAESEPTLNLKAYDTLSFEVARLHVMYGLSGAALPWITRDVIPL